jgi:hypothetical protein
MTMCESAGVKHITIDVPGNFRRVFHACALAVDKTGGIMQEKIMCGFLYFKYKRSFTCSSASLYICVTEKDADLCSVSFITRSYDDNASVRTYWRLIQHLTSTFQ